MEVQFTLSPWLLLVPVAVIVLVALKVPAVPALVVGIILGQGVNSLFKEIVYKSSRRRYRKVM